MTDRARTTVPSDPARVRITDVAPRDGLQNESAPISTQAKVQLVEALRRSGVDEVEVTSFVSPKWVPQLGDAAAVLAGLSDPTPGGPLLSALVPNEKGLDAFLASNERGLLGKASLFAAASETFSRRNTNGSIAEVLERLRRRRQSQVRGAAHPRVYLVRCRLPLRGPHRARRRLGSRGPPRRPWR